MVGVQDAVAHGWRVIWVVTKGEGEQGGKGDFISWRQDISPPASYYKRQPSRMMYQFIV
jgi:hypothetical protein